MTHFLPSAKCPQGTGGERVCRKFSPLFFVPYPFLCFFPFFCSHPSAVDMAFWSSGLATPFRSNFEPPFLVFFLFSLGFFFRFLPFHILTPPFFPPGPPVGDHFARAVFIPLQQNRETFSDIISRSRPSCESLFWPFPVVNVRQQNPHLDGRQHARSTFWGSLLGETPPFSLLYLLLIQLKDKYFFLFVPLPRWWRLSNYDENFPFLISFFWPRFFLVAIPHPLRGALRMPPSFFLNNTSFSSLM